MTVISENERRGLIGVEEGGATYGQADAEEVSREQHGPQEELATNGLKQPSVPGGNARCLR